MHAPASIEKTWNALIRRWRTRLSGPPARRPISLALQGGGAHGAFTWGVLDALLENGKIPIVAISGSSAGAVNAALVANGWMVNGPEGARKALADFWQDLGAQIPWQLLSHKVGDDGIELHSSVKAMASLMMQFSPANINPLAINPLRGLLVNHINFEQLRKHSPFALFLAATHVNSGNLKIFRETEITPDVLLASACLPAIHSTIEINGEAYWDGGYSANPPLLPLLKNNRNSDILLIMASPSQHRETPKTLKSIERALHEIGFESTLMREIEMLKWMIETAPKHQHDGVMQPALKLHTIAPMPILAMQSEGSRVLAHPDSLAQFKLHGIQRGKEYLAKHK